MSSEVRILIADDHPIVRQGLRRTIGLDPRMKVVAEASDGRAALEKIQALQPEIAVLDINMPQLDGFAVARAVREQQLPVKIIFLTVYREETFFDEALDLGAKGYVLKDSAVTEITGSIRAVAAGDYYTSPAMTSYLIKRTAPGGWRGRQKPGLDDLTPTERRILKLIAEYKTSREIAEALFISYRTVQTHRANICTKLEIQGSHALMKFALDHKSQL